MHCLTTLLGKHNISNICLAAAVAYRLGMSPTEIALGINKLSAIEHRLALLPNHREIVIIDDSYNANEDGIAVALEVLSTFPGRKSSSRPGSSSWARGKTRRITPSANSSRKKRIR